MPDYDYGNARLHVMKSRLLSARELEALTETRSVSNLIATLTKTVYQKSVEAALAHTTGIQCIDEALGTDLINTVGKIGGFYKEGAGKMTAIFLRTYDIHNLKALLRGLSKKVPARDILDAFLPIGDLKLSTLRKLAQLNDPREAIDVLASMGLSFAWPLLNIRAEIPGAETYELELALDKWYYQEACRTLQSETGMRDSLAYAVRLEADLVNVLTVLRFAQFPLERDRLRARFGTDEIESLFLRPGRISFALLADACRQDNVTSAVETLSGTFLGPALQAGLESYRYSNRLIDIEKQMRHYRLQWMAGQITQDPLGIGVVLGYVALKVNEVSNIRWITHGVNLGLKADAIRAELEMIP